MKRILIVNAYYYPGFRSGGPQQSVMNLVDVFGDQANFSILTHNYDLGDTTPYENVIADDWQEVGKAKVYYHSKKQFSLTFLRKIAKSFDIIYICEPYHDYSYKLLWLKKMHQLDADVFLAPMGVFSRGALSQKKLKKLLFWKVMKSLDLFRGITWSFTSEREIQEAMAIVGERNINRYIIAEDLPRTFVDYSKSRDRVKKSGELRIVFLSRICRQKNLLYVIQTLMHNKGAIKFDIYGTREDEAYWKQCLAALEQLPENIQWRYLGEVVPNKVMNIFSKYDVFCFPTLGENYGHVIYESLVAGSIPIISDQTPWNDLEEQGVGHIIPLEDRESYVKVIQKYVDMDDKEYNLAIKQLFGYAAHRYREAVNSSGYRGLI